jgi:hypothetical protein
MILLEFNGKSAWTVLRDYEVFPSPYSLVVSLYSSIGIIGIDHPFPR